LNMWVAGGTGEGTCQIRISTIEPSSNSCLSSKISSALVNAMLTQNYGLS
jgi:hypothetical protein